MKISTELIYDVKRKMLAKYPRFGSEIAVANIEFRENLPYHTVATDGKNVYVDPNYFESLSENERIFIIAHEIMHIKFMHMFRLKDKDGKKRDPDLWNIATDVIINANLERDGFTIKEGYVNMPEALNYSAEEFYQKLLEEKEKEQNEQQNGQKQEQGDGQKQGQISVKSEEQYNGQKQKDKQSQNQEENDKQENGQYNNKEKLDKYENQNSNECKYKGDDHSLWKETFKQQYSKEKGQKQSDIQKKQEQQAQGQEQISEEQIDMDFDERGEFEDNRKEKREKFKSRREKTQKDIRSAKEETIKLGNIGESKETIDWKVLIRRELEKTETIWSQRRSIAENNYAYRLEENDIEDEAETEIMIDTSGSVSLNLIKAFLRQIKPLLKQSKLRVGCFDTKFWGFVDIINLKDIDNFIVTGGGGTDLDLPVRSFTKKREINKIVFTDGYSKPKAMPKEDLKRENVIWLVYGNKNFKPCCGKVININEKQLEQLHQIDKNSFIDDLSR